MREADPQSARSDRAERNHWTAPAGLVRRDAKTDDARRVAQAIILNEPILQWPNVPHPPLNASVRVRGGDRRTTRDGLAVGAGIDRVLRGRVGRVLGADVRWKTSQKENCRNGGRIVPGCENASPAHVEPRSPPPATRE